MNEVVDLLNEILDELRTMNEKLDEIKWRTLVEINGMI